MREMRERGEAGVRDDTAISLGEKRTTDATEKFSEYEMVVRNRIRSMYAPFSSIEQQFRCVNFEILSRKASIKPMQKSSNGVLC